MENITGHRASISSIINFSLIGLLFAAIAAGRFPEYSTIITAAAVGVGVIISISSLHFAKKLDDTQSDSSSVDDEDRIVNFHKTDTALLKEIPLTFTKTPHWNNYTSPFGWIDKNLGTDLKKSFAEPIHIPVDGQEKYSVSVGMIDICVDGEDVRIDIKRNNRNNANISNDISEELKKSFYVN